MKSSVTLLALAFVSLPSCATENSAHASEPSAAQSSGEMDPAMMARMQELATPGAEHEEFEKRVGSWEQQYRFRWSPDAPWLESTGTSEAKTLLGGRYLMEEMNFSMMGTPIDAVSITGFDKLTGEYVVWWADSMSTWWITSHGKADANGVIDTHGTMVDVAGTRPYRMVCRPHADGTFETEMYDSIPPHGEVQVMTVRSKKKE
jgi:hypothetical protein